MGKKKAKIITNEGANQVLATIACFEDTDKGQHDRGTFADVVRTVLETNLFTRVELKDMGILKESITAAYNGASTNIDSGIRVSLINRSKQVARNFLEHNL